MFGAAGRGRRWWWRDIVVAWPSAVVAHVSAEEPTAHPNTHLPTNRVSKGLAALQWVWIASSGGGNRDVRLNLWRPVTGRRQGGPSGRVKRIRQQLVTPTCLDMLCSHVTRLPPHDDDGDDDTLCSRAICISYIQVYTWRRLSYTTCSTYRRMWYVYR